MLVCVEGLQKGWARISTVCVVVTHDDEGVVWAVSIETDCVLGPAMVPLWGSDFTPVK